MQRRELNAPEAPPVGAYAQVVEVSGVTRTVYISGQVASDANGKVPEDFAAQCRLVLANLQAQLRAVGMSLDNIVKLTTIMPDLANLGELRSIRGEVMGNRKHASTLIVAGLASPAYKVEIEAIACA